MGTALTTLLLGFRPESVTVLDMNEAVLTADHRRRGDSQVQHVLCDIRDTGRLQQEHAKARPEILFHLAAYKHVDWAELYPEEFIDTNLQGAGTSCASPSWPASRPSSSRRPTKRRSSASLYGRTKRLMEQLTALAARRARARHVAVRFVNVLESTGSASELFPDPGVRTCP